MFRCDFEVDAWSRFWRWNLVKICVWTCDMNSTLGSVVPLAMFAFYQWLQWNEVEQHTFIHYFRGWFLYKDISFVSKFSLFLLFFALLFVLLIFLIAFFFSFLLCLQLLLVQVLEEIFILLNSLLLLFRGFRVFALLARPLPVPLWQFSCRECLIWWEKWFPSHFGCLFQSPIRSFHSFSRNSWAITSQP